MRTGDIRPFDFCLLFTDLFFGDTRIAVQSMSNDHITSQPDQGQLVVLVLQQPEERDAFTEMLTALQLEVKPATSALEALQHLEDYDARLLIMDIEMPDMHGWQMLSKIREIDALRDLPIVVIADHANMGNTIAKVEYLKRPISIARLRQNILEMLTQHNKHE
ncbi:MAG: hypothetical protein OHK0046_26520 [Anaerolineae bacterium]